MKKLQTLSDEQLIIHALNWQANFLETGDGSISAKDNQERESRLSKLGLNLHKVSEHDNSDAEYIKRLRDIAKKIEDIRFLKIQVLEMDSLLDISKSDPLMQEATLKRKESLQQEIINFYLTNA